VECPHIAMLIMQSGAMVATLGVFAREVLLEWLMDIFPGNGSREHDLHGVGVLRRDDGTWGLVY
jgi:hypothetical protein